MNFLANEEDRIASGTIRATSGQLWSQIGVVAISSWGQCVQLLDNWESIGKTFKTRNKHKGNLERYSL